MLSLLSLFSFTLLEVAYSAGDYADLFTTEQYEIIASKRIRKEVRSLSTEEWERFAAALNTMKYTNQSRGEELYGDQFLTYDALLCKHFSVVHSLKGDYGHFAPHFLMWHRAIEMAFEDSLLAIDPEIGGMPYWDYREDVDDPDNSIIFSDSYYGSYAGNADEDYAVTDGYFAYWKVQTDSASVGCDPDHFTNAYGYMRDPLSFTSSPYVVRYPGEICGTTAALGQVEGCNECLEETTFVDFFSCQDQNCHGAAHWAIGGTAKVSEDQEVQRGPGSSCTSFVGVYTVVDNIYHLAYLYDCFDCEYETKNPDGCNITMTPEECGYCEAAETCIVRGEPVTIDGTGADQWYFGDFLDIATSPNDPIFFAHHSNLDRLLFIWQLMNYDLAPYYTYPESGYGIGNLYDNVQDAGLYGQRQGNNYTYADIFDMTTFLDSPYTYDTILEMIAPDTDTDVTTNGTTNDESTTTTEEPSNNPSTNSSISNNVYNIFILMIIMAISFC